MVAPGGLHAWLLGGVHGCSGACMVALGGVHGCSGGHAWLPPGVCMVAPGGVCGCSRGCMVAQGVNGCSWGGMGGFFWGGMRSCFLGGHAWFFPGACIGYDEIRSMSGRYASYWNAFLFFFSKHKAFSLLFELSMVIKNGV